MSYTPSVNIDYGIDDNFNYIVTPNARSVFADIVNGFNAGVHTFSIIGTYGTGKSSFLMALKRGVCRKHDELVENKKVLGGCERFEFLQIVGDYASLSKLFADKLNVGVGEESKNILTALSNYQQQLRKNGTFLFIYIDEFGKVLEHAANNNPEKELYFLQKLAEWVNVPTRNVILLTTLHQNFGSYASKLSETQRNEWYKVKGRYKELVFAEPIEQLLYLAANNLHSTRYMTQEDERIISRLYNDALKSRIINENLELLTVKKLFPLDAFSAACLTLAIQRYGQNERTLFSFLTDQSANSISNFQPGEDKTYNLALVYDYIAYNFYSALNETNADSMSWRAIRCAIERIESGVIPTEMITPALKIAKVIGLLTLFFPAMNLNEKVLTDYAVYAMGIGNAQDVIKKLTDAKIIRYANYRGQYILFEGTDIDIEDEMYKASAVVPVPTLTLDEIEPYLQPNVILASATYIKKGTPRYFQVQASNEPIHHVPAGDIDGYINLIFPLEDILERTIEESSKEKSAILYAYFKDATALTGHLHEIKKLQYLLENVILDDRVARAEITKQLNYEETMLNTVLNDLISSSSNNIEWIFQGKPISISSKDELNKYLSHISDVVYSKTSVIRNELFNKQKLSSAISLARVNLLDAMLANYDKADFGFPASNFPPEKTIYYTLFKNSGIHRQEGENYILGVPTNPELRQLWEVSEDFLRRSKDKPRKLTELVKILSSAPHKYKQGVIDFWLPIFLFIKQQEFALYRGDSFVINITKEVFELLQKQLGEYSVKTFEVSGVRLELFNQYRQFLNKDAKDAITTTTLMETIRPFFQFFRQLNNYAKRTSKFDSQATAKFRDILANAKDPAKAFIEDIPQALGYTDAHGEDFAAQYVDVLRHSVHELVVCYDEFINRIESAIVEHLGIDKDFTTYKSILENRYAHINKGLLTTKTRTFLERVLAPSANKKEFIEKIGLVVFDKKIEDVTDDQEPMFIANLLHLFSELERYTSFTNIDTTVDEVAYNFELASSEGSFTGARTYRLPKKKAQWVSKIERKIADVLSNDTELDICILLKMLNDRIK